MNDENEITTDTTEANGGTAETRRLVGVTIDDGELAQMKAVAHVDANGTAVLACARMGVEAAEARKAAAV